MDDDNFDFLVAVLPAPGRAGKQEAEHMVVGLCGCRSCWEEKWKQAWVLQGTALAKGVCQNALKQPVELSTGRRFEIGLVCQNSNFRVSLSAAPSMWVWLGS